MTFKAKIHGCIRPIENGAPGQVVIPFKFSKRRILFTKKHPEKFYYLQIPLACPFQNNSDYTLEVKYNKEDEKGFLITIAGQQNCKAYLNLNSWNRFKMNWIHRRYLIHRDTDWFWKTLIAAIIGFILTLIGTGIGYNRGYQSGLKEGKALHRYTIPKP